MCIYMYVYIYICVYVYITCKMAVRILLKIGRYVIQVSESNLGYVSFVHIPLFKWSNYKKPKKKALPRLPFYFH